LAARMRFFPGVGAGVRAAAPGLGIGVRVSAYDTAPFSDGVPETDEYPFAFGADDEEIDAFVAGCRTLGIRLLCITAGSPYYCPHVQRPAYFPPSDGYQPPRDPLHEVARMFEA